MIRVGILGVSGYTAAECIQWLLKHPGAQIVAATSRQAKGNMIDEVHPELIQRLRLPVEDLTPDRIAERCDVVFSCLPHGASSHRILEILKAGCRVIDLSPDYRLSSPTIYEKWFGEKHPDPQRLGNVPYGLPELFSDSIRESELVANPGCHATTVILPLAPLLKEKLVSPEDIVIDCKSSISVDGRALKMSNMYCESNESVTAYSVGSCRHQPEIVDILHRYSNTEVQMSFTPHWVPMGRGIFSTIYLKSTHGTTPNQIRECLNSHYSSTPFVRVVSHLPSTRYVSNSNYIDIAVRENGPRIVLFSAMDNLVKGAAGAAQQNMNCMFGLEPTMGLLG